MRQDRISSLVPPLTINTSYPSLGYRVSIQPSSVLAFASFTQLRSHLTPSLDPYLDLVKIFLTLVKNLVTPSLITNLNITVVVYYRLSSNYYRIYIKEDTFQSLSRSSSLFLTQPPCPRLGPCLGPRLEYRPVTQSYRIAGALPSKGELLSRSKAYYSHDPYSG